MSGNGGTSLKEQLKSRTIELVSVNEEKATLLSRVTELENENCRLDKDNRSSQVSGMTWLGYSSILLVTINNNYCILIV